MEVEKEKKYFDEVVDDDELTEEKVLEMINNPSRVYIVGNSYHNHVYYEKNILKRHL